MLWRVLYGMACIDWRYCLVVVWAVCYGVYCMEVLFGDIIGLYVMACIVWKYCLVVL